MPENMDAVVDQAIELGTTWGLKVLGGVLILVGGWIVAAWAARSVARACRRSGRVDRTLESYLSKASRIGVIAVTIIAVLNNFGVQTASIIAVLGAMGLAIGLALQGTLANVASGIVLLVLRPFKADDAIEVAGNVAIVKEVGLFATTLETPDGLYVLLPNAKIWGDRIVNLSRNPTRRVDLVFGISYADDMDKALEIIQEVIAKDERILDDPAPFIKVAELGDSSVNIYARPWTKGPDFFETKLDLTKRVKERFDAEGISIPFPQRDVHVHQPEPRAAA